LLIHIEDNRYKKELISFLDKVDHFSFPVEAINVYEEVATRLWRTHKHIFTEPEDIHIMIVGYDSFGKQIDAAANQLQLQNDNKQLLSITVLDRYAEYKLICNIKEMPSDTDKNQATFTHIFICLDEDYIDLMEGIELSELFSNTPIYMNFTDESIEQTLMIATTKTKKSLYSTGIIQDVLTKDYLGL